MSDQILPITIIVHTKNSAATLEQCLKSLPQTHELLVMDMQSGDDSLLIARRFHARTISVPVSGYVEAVRAEAIASASQPWILIVDADEELPKTAADWLADLVVPGKPDEMTAEDTAAVAYRLPRRNIIFGSALQHSGWWPDYQVRLFKAGTVTWPKHIHAQPEVRGKLIDLPATDEHAIIHHNYQSIGQFIDRMNRYTSVEAQTASTTEKTHSSNPVSSVDWLNLYQNELFSRLGYHQAWKDGEAGIAASLLQALYPAVTALKVWEHDGFTKSSAAPTAKTTAAQLGKLRADAAYWQATTALSAARGPERIWWMVRRKFRL